jgi:hypothetical protein
MCLIKKILTKATSRQDLGYLYVIKIEKLE